MKNPIYPTKLRRKSKQRLKMKGATKCMKKYKSLIPTRQSKTKPDANRRKPGMNRRWKRSKFKLGRLRVRFKKRWR